MKRWDRAPAWPLNLVKETARALADTILKVLDRAGAEGQLMSQLEGA